MSNRAAVHRIPLSTLDRNEAVSWATRQYHAGMHENGGSNRGSQIYELQKQSNAVGGPWCQSFVNYSFYKGTGYFWNRNAATGNVVSRNPHRIVKFWRHAIPGDWIYMGKNDGGHVGIIAENHWNTDNPYFVTIEGNWSNKVCKNARRHDDSYLWCVLRPPY